MSDLTLLLVDDDERSLKLLKAIFESEGYRTLTAKDGEVAFGCLLENRVDLVISEILMPNIDGYFLCYKIRSNEKIKGVPIIIYSGTFTAEGEEDIAGKMGANRFIRKPASGQALLSLVLEVLSETGKSPSPGMSGKPSIEVMHWYNAELIDRLVQRNLSLEEAMGSLEKTVAERTKDLDQANEALAAMNEALTTANEGLTTMDDRLVEASERIREQSDVIIRQQEEELKRSEQNLEIIFSNTEEGILVIDSNGRIVLFNNALRRFITFVTGEEPRAGIFMWDMTVPERREASRELFGRALRGEHVEVEAVVATSGGEIIQQLRYAPVFVDDVVKYVTIISVDITEKRRREIQLKRSEANLKAIFDSTPDGFILLDTDFCILAINENMGFDVCFLCGKGAKANDNIMDLILPERRVGFRELVDRSNRGEPASETHRHVINGAERWFEFSATPVKGDGKLIGYCISRHEITGIKKAESEIIRLNQSLTDFQNAIYRSAIVSMTDKAGRITFANNNFVEISGYSRDELVGSNHRVINSGYHPRSFWRDMWKTISSGKIWRQQVRNRRKDGSHYWVDTFIMPFVGARNEIIQYLSIRNDITAVKEAADELMQKRILLEEASRISKTGYWLQNQRTGEVTVSGEMLLIFGLSQGEYERDGANLHKLIHPEDAFRIPALKDLATGGGRMEWEYRIQKKDGSIAWIHQKGDLEKIFNREETIIGTVQDITERKMTEQLHREFNERFEFLSKATQDAIWDLDVKLDRIVWNHALLEIFGFGEDPARYNRTWWASRIHPQDRAQVTKSFDGAIKNQQNKWNSYFRFECADGSYKHVYNRSYILYEGNAPVRVIGSLQDISERVQATQEIEKLSLVASKTKNGVMITDKDGRIEWVNESFSTLTGYLLEDIKGQTSRFLQGQETEKSTIQRISEKIQKREFISEEIINYTKSGNKFWLKLDVAPVFDDEGTLKNFISVQTDITELKEFENSIVVIARELSSLIENANVPIFGVDRSGCVNEWNSVSAKLMEYSKHEAMGNSWKKILSPLHDSDAFESVITQAMNDIPANDFELPVMTRTGKRAILLVSTSPRRNARGEITGVLFVGQNITELTEYRNNLEKKVNEKTRDLHAALEKEKELVRMKSQFVSIASHEFRTPLTSIALAAGFIKKYNEKLSRENVEEKIATIEKQVNHMTYLLDDILMIGKVEAGKMPVHEGLINISEFIRNTCKEVTRTTGNTHQINLVEDLRYHEVVSDEKFLRNIVINLLTNAVKFSPDADRVDVSLRTGNEELHLIIKDYGIGIPEADIQNLFEPFFRGGNVSSIQGTGLGLSIIKKAVDLLKGEISLSSSVGIGTEITVKLPV